MFVADTFHNAVRIIDVGTAKVGTLAGLQQGLGDQDGTLSSAMFKHPSSLAIGENDRVLYVADRGNGKIRRITWQDTLRCSELWAALQDAFANTRTGVKGSNYMTVPPPGMASTNLEVCQMTHLTNIKNKVALRLHPATCVPSGSGTAAVACCATDGTEVKPSGKGRPPPYGCHAKSTYREAQQICAMKGSRLCTMPEVKGGAALSAQCGFDKIRAWTSTPEAPRRTPTTFITPTTKIELRNSANNATTSSWFMRAYKRVEKMGHGGTLVKEMVCSQQERDFLIRFPADQHCCVRKRTVGTPAGLDPLEFKLG